MKRITWDIDRGLRSPGDFDPQAMGGHVPAVSWNNRGLFERAVVGSDREVTLFLDHDKLRFAVGFSVAGVGNGLWLLAPARDAMTIIEYKDGNQEGFYARRARDGFSFIGERIGDGEFVNELDPGWSVDEQVEALSRKIAHIGEPPIQFEHGRPVRCESDGAWWHLEWGASELAAIAIGSDGHEVRLVIDDVPRGVYVTDIEADTTEFVRHGIGS